MYIVHWLLLTKRTFKNKKKKLHITIHSGYINALSNIVLCENQILTILVKSLVIIQTPSYFIDCHI